jgi:hypothetical protein
MAAKTPMRLKSSNRGRSYEDDDGPGPGGGMWMPQSPDPTLLTTQAVDKAVTSFKEDLVTRFSAMSEATKLVREQHDRLVADVPIQLEKSLRSMREFLTSEMAVIQQSIIALDLVSKEKFLGIAIQFEERDKRTEQLSQTQKEATNALSLASSTAVAAALQAQKESAGAQNESNAAAVAKSEAAFTKQIDQITVLITAIQKSQDDKMNDIKSQLTIVGSRLDRGEGNITGIALNRSQEHETRVEHSGNANNSIAIVAAVISAIAFVGMLVIALLPH